MKHKWIGIPEILMKKLLANAGVILCILIVGIFMEIRQGGEGFLKLTILCVSGLSIYFLNMCMVVFRKKYEMLEGEVTCIQICRGRKRHWEIGVMDTEGETKQLLIPVQSGVKKGKTYKFYLKNDTLLGIEEVCFESIT